MFETIFSVIQIIFSAEARAEKKRQRQIEATRLVGAELKNLANLFSFVLEATDSNGNIKPEMTDELVALRIRNWNQWVSILSSGAYELLEQTDREEIGAIIEVTSAAPGDYINEIFLIQKAESEGKIPIEVRAQFSGSISRLRNKAAQLRLAA
ncbi:MAG: hypothetical protein IIC11_07475 [Proteobacteria bacterium]|nr:hypothetical protein [Pseudomonadota bacterium]